MRDNRSELERARVEYAPGLPRLLREGLARVAVEEIAGRPPADSGETIHGLFPRTHGRPPVRLVRGKGPTRGGPWNVGVVLSGGQAPGGHNVIAGLFDALHRQAPGSRLLGFLHGPRGVVECSYVELTEEKIAPYRNTGGFDLIGSGRDKIETAEQLAACRSTCETLGLDGLVVIGGDDSNTNAAVIAEYLLEQQCGTRVAGVPKTIDGDMRGEGVEISFGFDTATKVYSELVGNICRDALSAGKYWHFIKLMGRSASHVTLECALQTHPNVALIGEEVQQRGLTLGRIVDEIAETVRLRAEKGRNYGVCLVPEGLIEFVPEMRRLIADLNRILSEQSGTLQGAADIADKERLVRGHLPDEMGALFGSLPSRIRHQLLLDRDSHGNVQVSKIDTESLLVERVADRLAEWKREGEFAGKFQVQSHFFGYEGRCAAPSNFDADYTYSLGHVAAALIAFERTGYLCSVRNLELPPAEWQPGGVPLTSLMHVETRKGKPTPVIAKALVRTDHGPFATFAALRERWALGDEYSFPGAVQYFGPREVCARVTRTLSLERPR